MRIPLTINSGIKLLVAVFNSWASDILLNLICTKPIGYTFNFLIYSYGFFTTSEIYNRLGQHNYKTKDTENITEYIHTYTIQDKYIYFGQLKDGTNQAEGVGIRVWSNGTTQYLYNKNNAGVLKRESGRMVSLMDMWELQICWCWNALNTIS